MVQANLLGVLGTNEIIIILVIVLLLEAVKFPN